VKTGNKLRVWKGLVGSVRVAFSPDGRFAASGEAEHISLWDVSVCKVK
jgi:hypothetical protein